jgi:phosphoglycerate dehydrogenase-like enzyme
MKIVIAGIHGLSDEQINRLNSLGELIYYEDVPKTKEEKFSKLKDADVICGETDFIMDVIYELKDKLISFPFVGIGFLDLGKLSKNNVKVANAPGCNKAAVSEWVISTMLILSRKLKKYMNIKKVNESDFMEPISGLAGKKVTILGNGNIGSKVGSICSSLEMEVDYFTRKDSLLNKVKNADFIINALSRNKETENLLDKDFFGALKDGVYLISIADTDIFNIDAFREAVSSEKIAGAAIDPAGVSIFSTDDDFYKEFVSNDKVIVTPHIAFHNDMTLKTANDIMINNVEAWVKHQPINLVN